MNERIEQIIAKLERIPVNGINAILMGDSLKELLAMKAEQEKAEQKQEEENADD